MAEVSVIGAGSWGSALASVLCKNGHNTVLWSHRQSQVDQLNETRENDKLPGVKLPQELVFTASLEEAVTNKDLIVLAVPSTAARETAHKMQGLLAPHQRIVTVAKGIEEHTLMTQCEIIEDELPDAIVGVLSGPSHAEEVVEGLPTLVVAGARDRMLALLTQEVFMNESFRVYVSPDVKGIELGGSLKNVIALAAGMSDGLGFGDNAKAALITRGVKEITSLAVAMGGQFETVNGLTGIGDLIVTCSSRHSRNRKAGVYIGQGMEVHKAMEEVHMVVEGVYSAKSALALGQKYGVELPIIEQVNAVLFDGASPQLAVENLMTRNKKAESEVLSWNS
ncbi:MAG: NAD(P)-dependent glycerol-3-phosphate dehydrogenase [Lachnospiraceae bacterium]|nr:NAD(P)-dependent glycerol-3-phosphate dehydrogenase [Lachnospiraceae bacterium]